MPSRRYSTFVRVFKRGSQWGVDFRTPGGGRTRRIVGTRAQAEAALARIRLERYEGRYHPEQAELRKTPMTIGDLRDLWLQHAAGKRSIKTDRQRLSAIVAFYGEHTALATISPRDVLRLREELLSRITRRGRPMTPATVNRHLATLRAAFKLAIRHGGIKTSPVHGSQLLEEDPARDRICSPDELDRLLAGTTLPHLRLAIVLGYETVMRLGEIRDLTRSRIDLDAGMVHLRKTKSGKVRDVPLSSRSVQALRDYLTDRDQDPELKEKDAIFSVTMETLSSEFADLVKRLGIVDLHFHDLRHTAATRMRRAGVDILTLKRIGGWETWDTMERYQHVGEDDLRDAIEKLEKHKPKK